jgi:cytoskeletal protein RodZ
MVGLLDSSEEDPRSKLFRWTISGAVLALLVALGIWHLFRFHTEKERVARFLQALASGDTQQAYRLWEPQVSYTYNDFLQDWGPTGFYGPVKSFRIVTAQQERGASGVVVVAEVSPEPHFPADENSEASRRTKEVKIWVERSDQSMSFPP